MSEDTQVSEDAIDWRKSARRAAWWSFGIALITVSAWWIFGGFLDGWLFALYMPSLAIAIFFSGGPHSINPVIGFIAQLIQTFLMIYVVVMGTIYLRIKRRKTEKSMGPE